MIASTQADQVTLVLSRGEVARLAGALAEGASGSSRAEYFIRVGCSLPNIEAIVAALESIADGRSNTFELEIVAGVEGDENPRRPRGRLEGR
jgi:hypothetical protein